MANQNLKFTGPGITKTKAGHLRYTSPKELRNEYVHRKVILDLIEEMPYSLQALLPWPFEVHHCDYCKENNTPSNLIMLDIAFHSYMTADGRRRRLDGKFLPKTKLPPKWMPLYDGEPDTSVPF